MDAQVLANDPAARQDGIHICSLQMRPMRAAALTAATTKGKDHRRLATSAKARFDNACIFLFGVSNRLEDEDSETEKDTELCRPGLEALRLPKLTLVNVATGALMPVLATTAYSIGFTTSSVVTPAMMPMFAPETLPHVSGNWWVVNKRARAFHRCCVIAVYTQGVFSLLKLVRGDLVGGLFDMLQTGIGLTATQPQGISVMPTYVMVAGFNGVLGMLQVFQSFQGIPIRYLPILVTAPPICAIIAALCGWQICKEIRAMASGTSSGPQDSFFVRICSADFWPLSVLSPTLHSGGGDDNHDSSRSSARQHFSAFGGSGWRLGED